MVPASVPWPTTATRFLYVKPFTSHVALARYVWRKGRASMTEKPRQNHTLTNFLRGGALTIVGCLSITAVSVPASAAALFVHRGPTKAPGENTCMGFALDAAKRQHLQNIEHKNSAVSGAMADKFVVMTCVGTTVVIAVAGDHAQEVKPLADALFAEISRIQNID